MTDLLIQYKDSEGHMSERTISDIEVEGAETIVAFCHLRQDRRMFILKRIHSAIDMATGELVDDLYVYFGIPHAELKKSTEPSNPSKPITLSVEELQRRRSKEKYHFWGRFGPTVIADHFKKKLFSLFGNKCFKCAAPERLEVDHHLPIVLGGHLVPGNLVALCTKCNNRKLDLHPSQFYSKEELAELEPILEQEASLFEFVFDWERWRKNRKEYLLSIGIDVQLVDEVLNNPSHRFYIEPPSYSEDLNVTITIDAASLIQRMREQ